MTMTPTEERALAHTLWKEMIREEAQYLADRDNSCDACCGSYVTATWKEYEQQVRNRFEEIGKAFMALAAIEARGGKIVWGEAALRAQEKDGDA